MMSASIVESRKSKRAKVVRAGTISTSNSQTTWPCVVRNISEAGALIQAASTYFIPQEFNLLVELEGLDAKCEVVWRRGTKVGVRFLEKPET